MFAMCSGDSELLEEKRATLSEPLAKHEVDEEEPAIVLRAELTAKAKQHQIEGIGFMWCESALALYFVPLSPLTYACSALC